MSHIVKCAICGKTFNRDVVQAVRHGARRYSHYDCEPDGELVPMEEKKVKKEDKDLIALKEYIEKLYGKKANWAQIKRQLKIYTTEYKYSYSGIMKSLIYFYEVKSNSIEKSNYALGIVPFIYNDAYNYYYNLFLAQNQNAGKDFNLVLNQVKEITIPLPAIREKKKMFKLQEGEE